MDGQTPLYQAFFGHLNGAMTEERLKGLAISEGGLGVESILKVEVRRTGVPLENNCIGFITFASREALEQAIKRLNAREIIYEINGEAMSAPMFVSEAVQYPKKSQ